MDGLDLLFIPKAAPVSCQQISRTPGYLGRVIHMHDLHELCLVASASECQVFSGGNRWCIHGPAIILHRAGSYHEMLSVSADSVPYDSRLVYFQTEGLPSEFLPKRLFDHDCLICPVEDASPLLSCFDLLKGETGSGRLLALLLLLQRITRLPKEKAIRGDAKDSYIFDIIKTIHNDLTGDLTIRRLAQLFHISESKLKKDFSATTGTTLKQFITSLRLRQACNLLQTTGLEVAEVAYRCGFSGESHFIETFRKHLGITPGKYRKEGNRHV